MKQNKTEWTMNEQKYSANSSKKLKSRKMTEMSGIKYGIFILNYKST